MPLPDIPLYVPPTNRPMVHATYLGRYIHTDDMPYDLYVDERSPRGPMIVLRWGNDARYSHSDLAVDTIRTTSYAHDAWKEGVRRYDAVRAIRGTWMPHYDHTNEGVADLHLGSFLRNDPDGTTHNLDLYVTQYEGEVHGIIRWANDRYERSLSRIAHLRYDTVTPAVRELVRRFDHLNAVIDAATSARSLIPEKEMPMPDTVTTDDPPPFKFLDELTFCLEQGFPAPVTEALLVLAGDRTTTTLRNTFKVWEQAEGEGNVELYDHAFTDVVSKITGDGAFQCGCDRITWDDEGTWVEGGYEQVCERCIDNYSYCDRCEEYVSESNSINDGDLRWCESCTDRNATFCDACDEYYSDGDHYHEEDDCDCEAPIFDFDFPANGQGVVTQDERLTVELPKGTIDAVGLDKIKHLLYQHHQGSLIHKDGDRYGNAYTIVDEVGPLWQGKRGNFTRRLSRAFYEYGVKLADGLLTEVGNIARAHSSSKGAEWQVEFTRDLNLSASDFYHSGSCWWGSESQSRCALKSWGGLAMRSFGAEYGDVTGRIWVQPLTEDLTPTHDTVNAHAYIVYNGYGQLGGEDFYTAARIVAHLTSKTYRKVSFGAYGQYVNSGGILIADEETCAETSSVEFGRGHDVHDQFDAREVRMASEGMAA